MALPTTMSHSHQKISGDTVRDDFNAINTVLHYTRAAHFIGLWKSEVALIERYFPSKDARRVSNPMVV